MHVVDVEFVQPVWLAYVLLPGASSSHWYAYGGLPPEAPESVMTAVCPCVTVCDCGEGVARVRAGTVVVVVEVEDVVEEVVEVVLVPIVVVPVVVLVVVEVEEVEEVVVVSTVVVVVEGPRFTVDEDDVAVEDAESVTYNSKEYMPVAVDEDV